MLNTSDILETIHMISEENLDVRTVTMGISLLDCVSDDLSRLETKIYDKITKKAEKLVSVCTDLEKSYGVPIINKRVSVTPVSMIGGAIGPDGYVRLAHTLQRAADTLGINFIGGYSALVQKGMTVGARNLIESIPEALATTSCVCSSVNVATTKAGINMDAVKLMGEIIKKTAYLTKDNDSIGCAKLVVFANVPEDNPFMAGALHGVGEPDTVINVGVSGPGVVACAVKKAGDCDFGTLAETIKKIAFKITRVGQLVAYEASRRLDTPYGIVDLSLAPTPAQGDSVAHILENMGLEEVGVEIERDKVKVDEHYKTSLDGVYAIGDIIATPALAHVASAEAIHCVEYICGLNPEPVDYSTIPSCIFTSPEVASVGLTEAQVKAQGIEYKVGKFPYTASGKATAAGERDGFVKLIFDAEEKLLGAHFVGHNVTEMIGEPTLAKVLGVNAHRIARTIHAHPSMHEAVMEAAEDALGCAIHM